MMLPKTFKMIKVPQGKEIQRDQIYLGLPKNYLIAFRQPQINQTGF